MSLNRKEIIINKTIFMFSFVYFIILLFFIFYDGIGKKGSSGVSGFIEQDALRKSLGDWYQLVFYTFHINIYCVISGMLYGCLSQNKIVQNMFFCSSSYMLLCLFSMFVFRFTSFSYNFYESLKTLFVHFIIPSTSLIFLFIVRNRIILDWKILWINSLYVTFFIILSLIIYFNFYFTEDSLYPGQHLWIYGFLDYDNQIMFVPLPTLALTILGIIATLIISPFVGMAVFLFFKILFKIKINPIVKYRNKRL